MSATSIHYFSISPSPSMIYTLSLHDALPISRARHGNRVVVLFVAVVVRAPEIELETAGIDPRPDLVDVVRARGSRRPQRSEEQTSELQSHSDLVCRLLLEKKRRRKR